MTIKVLHQCVCAALELSMQCFNFLQDSAEDKADLTNPIKNRGCTDIIILILFVLFWAGMVCIQTDITFDIL